VDDLRALLRPLTFVESDSINEIETLTLGPQAQRVRVDLTLYDGILGFYKNTLEGVFQLETCSHFTPELQNWFNDFSKFKWPFVKKGSVRLRISPSGQRGVWLDFSNQNIKDLLDERTTLKELLKVCIVEIGQKRKRLVLKNDVLKLTDPSPSIWFQTFIGNQSYPLEGFIGGFTQPSWISNALIIQALEGLLSQIQPRYSIEWGAGIGNLTLPLSAATSDKVLALELEPLSVINLKNNLLNSPFSDKVEVLQGDFQKLQAPEALSQYIEFFKRADLLVVNPPRSGLKDFVFQLREDFLNPKHIIYLSCNPKTMVEDGLQLSSRAGYSLEKVYLIDQFPQTTHYETLSLWSKN